MVAKVAGGIIGLGLIGTGSVAMAKPEWFGINKESWKPLSQDSDFNADSGPYASTTFGGTYKNYLTGVKGNQDWWKESFERLKEDSRKQDTNQQPSAQFKFLEGEGDKKVTLAFDNSNSPDEKALNQICKKVYKETTTNIKSDPSSSGSTEYKDIDVWKYCSPVGAVPKKVSEQTDELGSSSNESWIGKTKGGELLSTKHKDNEKLWELKNDEFFGRGVFKSATSRTFDSNDKFFKALFNQKNNNTNKDALKNKCEEAYKLTSETTPSDENKTNDAHVVKYCSLKSI